MQIFFSSNITLPCASATWTSQNQMWSTPLPKVLGMAVFPDVGIPVNDLQLELHIWEENWSILGMIHNSSLRTVLYS